jgi:hypothetical protein
MTVVIKFFDEKISDEALSGYIRLKQFKLSKLFIKKAN